VVGDGFGLLEEWMRFYFSDVDVRGRGGFYPRLWIAS
jgi:hypothetical protein